MMSGALWSLRFRLVLFATLTILPGLILIVYTASVRRQLDARELMVAPVHPLPESDGDENFSPIYEPAADAIGAISVDSYPEWSRLSNGLAVPPSDSKSLILESRPRTTHWTVTGAGRFPSAIGGLVEEAAAAEETEATAHSNDAGARRTLWRHLWIAAMALWLLFLAAWLRSNLLILRHVESLAATAKRIIAGDFRARAARPQRRDELSQLAADFNAMAAALQLKDEETKRLELQKNNAGLESSNQAKSDFLSLMSHEFRTPLSLIVGYAAMMQDGLLGHVTEEQRNGLEQIMRCSDELLAILMRILQVTSIESGVIRIRSDEFNPHDLLAELKSDCVLAEEKEVQLIWDYPANLPRVKTDRDKLKHVLQTLIDNAVKFTDHGRVVVSSQSFPEQGRVEFKIADTGVGIPSEALSLVFEKFHQLDSSITRPYGGVGLGLFIAKKFTELLGGELVASSVLGKGSTFTVTLPLAA